MTGALEKRAREAGEARAAQAAERLAAALRADLPGAEVGIEGGAVRIARRGLRADPALRWPGGLLR